MVTRFLCVLTGIFLLLASPAWAQTSAAAPDDGIVVVYQSPHPGPTIKQAIAKIKARERERIAARSQAKAAVPKAPTPRVVEIKPPPPAPAQAPAIAPAPLPSPPPAAVPMIVTDWTAVLGMVVAGALLLAILIYWMWLNFVRRGNQSSAVLADEMNAVANLCNCAFTYHLKSYPTGYRSIQKKVKIRPDLGWFELWLKRPGFPSDKSQGRNVEQVLERFFLEEKLASAFRLGEVFYRRGWVVIRVHHRQLGGNHE